MSRQFDAVVIGSGLGGLTAGALYARAGNRVLVLERNHNFGGAATVYRHGALAIEASLHEIDGLDGEDPKMPILRSLGLDRQDGARGLHANAPFQGRDRAGPDRDRLV